MKKIILFIFTILFIVTISSCDDSTVSTIKESNAIESKESNSSNDSNNKVNNSASNPTNNQAEEKDVVDKSIKSITLSNTLMSLMVGRTSTIFVNYDPVDADNRYVNWFSSNPNIATVSPNGMVSAISKGKTTITARTINGKESTCNVTVTGEAIYVNTSNYENYFDFEHEILNVDSSYNLPIVSYISLKDGYEITKTVEMEFEITVYYKFKRRPAGGGPGIRTSGEQRGYIKAKIEKGKKMEVITSYIKIGNLAALEVSSSFFTNRRSVSGNIEKVKVV